MSAHPIKEKKDVFTKSPTRILYNDEQGTQHSLIVIKIGQSSPNPAIIDTVIIMERLKLLIKTQTTIIL